MKRLVLALWIAFGAAAPGVTARAGDAPPPGGNGTAAAEAGDERDVPEPRLPGVEALSPGVEPESWTSWYTGQDIDGTPRIDLKLSAGSGAFDEGWAGAGVDAPKYKDISDAGATFFLGVAYRLSPALSLGLTTIFLARTDREFTQYGPGTSTSYSFTNKPILGAGLALRLTVPFAHLNGRFLDFSRTEAPTGLALHLQGAVGMAYIGRTQVWWPDSATGMTLDATYFKTSMNPTFAAGFGLEYRWVSFGLFFEFHVVDFGTPEPSADPLWAASSAAAESMIAFLGSVGISLHF